MHKIGSRVDVGLDYDPYEICDNSCSSIAHPIFLLYFSRIYQFCISAYSVDTKMNYWLLG